MSIIIQSLSCAAPTPFGRKAAQALKKRGRQKINDNKTNWNPIAAERACARCRRLFQFAQAADRADIF